MIILGDAIDGDLANTSWLQWLVVVKSFIMAAKGPAEDFLADRIRRQINSEALYHEKGLKQKLLTVGMILLKTDWGILLVFEILNIWMLCAKHCIFSVADALLHHPDIVSSALDQHCYCGPAVGLLPRLPCPLLDHHHHCL